jgi:glucuronate isomerase
MKEFLNDNFLLNSSTAEWLYHSHAKDLPIIDYHCHLPVEEIAIDHQFENLTKIWLNGDHYKWRAMRTHGIPEKYCTGNATDFEKFEKWAETVPFTLRNPLYHWTHLELKKPFGIHEMLNPASALSIWRECGSMLQSKEFSTKNILRKMKVEVICTTDDPIDKLEYHKRIKADKFEITVLPTWRPDRAMQVEDPTAYLGYLSKLEAIADLEIRDYNDLIAAIQKRHDFFHIAGCRLSDHGLDTFFAEDYSESEIQKIFHKLRRLEYPDQMEIRKFKSALLLQLSLMDFESDWTQQFHIGALRNNSSRKIMELGPDTGFDSIGDFEVASPMARFFDSLDRQNKLAKTIIYNLNPRDNEVFATMCGNFNDGSVAGKIQYGSAWWFLDQKDGMERQLNVLSNMGLLSHFVGMITDSRSFLSYPRHEYFRRILCNTIGQDVENGEIPNDEPLLATMVENICYYNAKNYFGFNEKQL